MDGDRSSRVAFALLWRRPERYSAYWIPLLRFFHVQVTDSVNAAASGTFTLPVNTPASLMFVTTSPLPTATVGVAYSQVFSAREAFPPILIARLGYPRG